MLSLIGFFSLFISIALSLNFSHLLSNILSNFFPNSDNLLLAFISIITTFFISSFLIKKIASSVKYILDMSLIGILDDISGAVFGFLTTALFLSFLINLYQYFDLRVFEEEIRSSLVSLYIQDLAPNTFAYFFDFFPSLEFIVQGLQNNEITT